jgi:hypothetical protein
VPGPINRAAGGPGHAPDVEILDADGGESCGEPLGEGVQARGAVLGDAVMDPGHSYDGEALAGGAFLGARQGALGAGQAPGVAVEMAGVGDEACGVGDAGQGLQRGS